MNWPVDSAHGLVGTVTPSGREFDALGTLDGVVRSDGLATGLHDFGDHSVGDLVGEVDHYVRRAIWCPMRSW